MGIQDLINSFRQGGQQQQAQQPQQNPNQTTPGNIPDNASQLTQSLQTPGAAPNGAVPNGTNVDEVKSPLDPFAKLWEDDPALKVVDDPLFKITNDQLVAASRTQDFRNSVTKEQLTAIAKGGPDAVEAFASALNTLAQDTYARSAVATTKLIEGALAKNNGKLETKFNQSIRSNAVNNSLMEDNPAFNHPAAAPLIAAMKTQMELKFPNASPKEITQMAQQYLTAFSSSVVAPQQAQNSSRATGDDTDWGAFLQ